MLYSYFAVAFLAVQLSGAVPRNRAQDGSQPCHGDIVDEETILKSKYSKQHDTMRIFEQDYRAVISTINTNTNIATKIAGEAGKLGDSKDVFKKVLDGLESQDSSMETSIENLHGALPLLGTFADKVIDAFELLSHGLEGEFDILKYKEDVINAEKDCEGLVVSVQLLFNTYERYNRVLSGLFYNPEQRKKLTDLTEDPTSNYSELLDTLECKDSELQSALESSWHIVVDLL